MIHRNLCSAVSPLLVIAISLTQTSCGNAWIASTEREETLAALMSKAEYAYDKSNFSESARYFSLALKKDPTFDDARIKLAYALNGVAGLNILDFVTKFLVKEETTGSATTAGASASSLPVKILTDTVGQDAAAIESLKGRSFSSIADVREASERFRKLRESWTTVCSLMPAALFESVFQTEPASLKELFPIEACGSGLAAGQSPRSAALFAAALQFMAQAADLFQVILDADGDNEIDLAQRGTAALAELNRLQQNATALNAGVGDNPETYSQILGAINAQLGVVRELRGLIGGEVLNYTLACFTFISVIISQIPNIPPEISKKIEGATIKINEGRSKLAQYLNVDVSSPNSEQGSKVKEAAEKAQRTIDDLYTKVNAMPDGEDKNARLAKLDEQRDDLCANFEATKSEFGLPETVQRPASCAAALSIAAAGSPDAPQSQQGDNAQNEAISKTFHLWRPVPLPSELNSLLPRSEDAQRVSTGSGASPQEVMMGLLEFGEALRKR
jgi:tetratricopeptide (TPR) repeat protein